MNLQKKILDVRMILTELSIPFEKYEEWLRTERKEDEPLFEQRSAENWKPLSPSTQR